MSVAFTREESAETAAEFQLADRAISPHPNFVTPSGLNAIEKALTEARGAYEAAQRIDDINERRRKSAPALRDLKYFAERLRTAQFAPSPSFDGSVSFGSRVTFARNRGPFQSFRIIGEDEADPRQGSISYTSPLARLLLGKTVGEVVRLGDAEIDIVAIEI